MKQSLFLGKSYIIANAIIGVNHLEGRNIVDEEDIKNVEFIVKTLMKQKNYDLMLFDDIKDSIENQEVVKDNGMYIKIPGISIDNLKEKYRNNLPFNLTNTFQEVDNNELLKRNEIDNIIFKRKEKKILSDFPITFEENKPKVLKKEYRVSEK